FVWPRGAPGATGSPDFTKIFVTRPSTSGWTVVERSERMVAMNSEACSTGLGSRVRSLTAVGGGAWGAPAAAPFGSRQAAEIMRVATKTPPHRNRQSAVNDMMRF